MKKRLSIFVFLVLILLPVMEAPAYNPFVSIPEKQHQTSGPSLKNPAFVKIILWQHRIRQKMAELVREARSTGNPKPLLFLFGLAFLYGMVHSAGPGHGKLVAMSYLISCGRRYSKAVLLGNLIAFFHGLSGVVFVLTVRLLMQRTITGTLEETSHKARLISFGLVFILGLLLLLRSFQSWRKTDFVADNNPKSSQMRMMNNPVVMALAVGMVPCPGVVLVMLFCLSMKMTGLGVVLSFWIILGMALTITAAVLFGLTGKRVVNQLTGRRKRLARKAERIIETLAAFAVTALGLVFFMANY